MTRLSSWRLCYDGPSLLPSTVCRMCADSHERFSHIQMCDTIEEAFQQLAALANALGTRCENDQQFRALGLASGEFLQGTLLSDLHINFANS